MSCTEATILIADDEPHILRVVGLKVSSAGFRVVEAHDGESAWHAVQREAISLVVADHQMPQLTGVGLAKRLHGDRSLAQVPVILLTARSFAVSRADLADTNVVSLVSKPFSPKELLATIITILNAERPEMLIHAGFC